MSGAPSRKEARGAAYFILGKLLKAAPLWEYRAFCLERIAAETDKYTVSGMLDRVAGLTIPPDLPIDAILARTRDEKWLIRHSALCALGSSATPEARSAALFHVGHEDGKAHRFDIYYGIIALNAIGLPEDIPHLRRHLNSRIRDIRDTARCAIAAIEERAK